MATPYTNNNELVLFVTPDMALFSKLEFRNIYRTRSLTRTNMGEYVFKFKLTDQQKREMKMYTNYLSVDMILFGLRFAFKRSKAISGGYLLPGRKSIIKRETRLLSRNQAEWRLNNWKSMIRSYRQKGYSYPTISRIKKEVNFIASNGGSRK